MAKVETQAGIDYFNNVARRFVDKYIECKSTKIRDKLIIGMSKMMREDKGVTIKDANKKIIYKN